MQAYARAAWNCLILVALSKQDNFFVRYFSKFSIFPNTASFAPLLAQVALRFVYALKRATFTALRFALPFYLLNAAPSFVRRLRVP